ncbi:MAG TPA: antibiotic biosynthesis monooxygenase [Ignavibacteriaceae bacterium]|nr:antibiotic biosynthesis monooxygenase [Ignavibacteriaceae bacterium]
MHIVHVYAHVKPDQVEAFKTATVENAQNSLKEPGVARFDVIQNQDDPTKFILVEIYLTVEDSARHKETAHYRKWRNIVAPMMADQRTSQKFTNIFPGENGWQQAS